MNAHALPYGFGRPIRLTKREAEVLMLVAHGRTSLEAANKLAISKRTVDFHLANVFDKLRADNRVQAFRIAEELGLLTWPDPDGEGPKEERHD